MKQTNFLKATMAVAILLNFNACKKSEQTVAPQQNQPSLTQNMMAENGANPDELSVNQSIAAGSTLRDGNSGHYLYTESNAADKNNILVYKIKNNGTLHFDGAAAGGGTGIGKPLGSQGALVLDKNNRWLFAVNAGSNSVSSFKINDDGGLTLAHTSGNCGLMPVSVAVSDDLLYVLNRGSDDIRGFRIGAGGTLTPVDGSIQPLSSKMVDAPQISFTPDGNFVVVTEKATNIIGTFKVKNSGAVNAGLFTASAGQTPFGFAFSRDKFMIVSDAAGGAAGAGATTAYAIGNNGKPHDINGAVPSLQGAPCWVAVTKYGRFAFVTNAASNNISSYYVAPWGAIYLVNGEAAKTDKGPNDIVVAANNYDVFELNTGGNSIGGYHRTFLGGLGFTGNTTGVPVSATGLATF